MTTATYLDIVFFSLVGSVFSLIGGVVLLMQKRRLDSFIRLATPFAAGSLLAAVFLDLLKDGLQQSSTDTVLMATLIGLVLFFMIERATHWFHHHHDEADQERKNIGLIIAGDTLHNALDGVAIASSFLISVPTGIVTTIAVAAHEIPQEIGDFGLLLARGVSRRNVLLMNVVSALSTVIMALVVFALGSSEKLPIGALLGLSAGFLLYIASSDLIPSIHQHAKKTKLVDVNVVMLILGIVVVGVSVRLAHHFAGV